MVSHKATAMIDICYQYMIGPAQWEEIRYSLRSVEKYFEDDYRIWFVGHQPQGTQNVYHLDHNRENPAHRRNDQLNKLMAACNCDELSDDIIWMYDDQYLLKPTTANYMAQPLAQARIKYRKPRAAGGLHGARKWASFKAIAEAGREYVYDFETHLPRLFNRHLMKEALELYRAKEKRRIPFTLYYNHYFEDDQIVLLNKQDEYRAMFHRFDSHVEFLANDAKKTRDILDRKHYLNHNNRGLTDILKAEIMHRFPEPSRYEI